MCIFFFSANFNFLIRQSLTSSSRSKAPYFESAYLVLTGLTLRTGVTFASWAAAASALTPVSAARTELFLATSTGTGLGMPSAVSSRLILASSASSMSIKEPFFFSAILSFLARHVVTSSSRSNFPYFEPPYLNCMAGILPPRAICPPPPPPSVPPPRRSISFFFRSFPSSSASSNSIIRPFFVLGFTRTYIPLARHSFCSESRDSAPYLE
mmetsp:Transcript_20334/g.58797  ORF Transcript_20334/g.58797 Transcript_20334/m.58797 type:complete len:211 (-) Transcript_20334:643-1275(-)